METSPELQRRATGTRVREYTGPLGILAAGAIGLSLLCSVSAMAMGDLNRYIPITLEPISIVDLAVSNFGTAAALTEQIVTVFVPTETLGPTATNALASITPQPTDTQRRFVTITPTNTRRPRLTMTAAPAATRTSRPPTRAPTRTSVPTRTKTPVPPTHTPVPPTNTPQPTIYPDHPTSTNAPPPTIYP